MTIERDLAVVLDRVCDLDTRLERLERLTLVNALRGLSYEQLANAVIYDHVRAVDLMAFMEIHYGSAPALRNGVFVLAPGTAPACVRFLEELNEHGAGVLISKG